MAKIILVQVAIAPHSTQLASTLDLLEPFLASVVADGLLLEHQQVAARIVGVDEPRVLRANTADVPALEAVLA